MQTQHQQHVGRISYKQHLSIKKPTANELKQETVGGTLAGGERILGNSRRIKGETQGETLKEDSKDEGSMPGLKERLLTSRQMNSG